MDVIPAIGKSSIRNPANVLAKIARAYLASVGQDGKPVTFSDHIRGFVNRFADPSRYDVILVDARAGLHETTSAAIVGLGAEVFLFGLDQEQTFTGYELLFAHLSNLPRSGEDFWAERLHPVQSKAPADQRLRARFAKRMEDLLTRYLWTPVMIGSEIDSSELADTFEVDWTDDHAVEVDSLIEAELPPTTIAILDDDRFRGFDPGSDRDSLADAIYVTAFGPFIDLAEQLVFASIEPVRDISND